MSASCGLMPIDKKALEYGIEMTYLCQHMRMGRMS
jgi:hypothetical protein